MSSSDQTTDSATAEPDETPGDSSPDRALARPAGRRPWWVRTALVLGVLAAALVVGLGGLVVARAGEALPGTHVAAVDVGGLGEADLRAEVERVVASRRDTAVPVTAAGQSFTFTPGTEGYEAEVDATVQAALEAGRGGFLGLGGHVAATFGDERRVELSGGPVEAAVTAFVQDVASEVDQPMSPGTVRVNPDSLEVRTWAPQRRVSLDVPGATEALLAVVGDADPEPVELPAETTPPPTDEAAVADAADRAQRAVADALVLRANGGALTLSPSDVARVLRTEERDGRLALVAHPGTLTEVVSDQLSEVEDRPRDATFDVVSGLTTLDDQGSVTWSPQPADVRVVPSESGHTWDEATAAEQVGRLLDDGTREAELQLEEVPADLTTADAEALGVDNLIGTFTTYHDCCQNRVTNIHRIADIVRGAIVRPGETFSINDHVGQRTRAKGFVADGVIINGELEEEVGGGISQFATTTYNAAFFAGIEIVDHQAHSYYISRYPLGREATLNYGTIDLVFRNTTDNGIYIHTSYTGESITVSLFGDNGGRTVRAVAGEPYDYEPHGTRTRATNELYEGQRRVVQSGMDGFRVTIERVISGGGIDRTEEITTVYAGRPEIVEYGTRPRPGDS